MTDLLTFSSPSSLVPPIRKLSILVLTILAIGFGADVTHAQTTFAELSQAVKAPNAIAKIGTDLFGDQVNLYTGSLEFVQSDISLRGNSALQVSAGRRLVTGVRINSYGPRQFGLWELEIPRIHGAFSDVDGWKVWGANPNARCSAFSEPRDVYANGAYWNASEFWQGSFMYIPGQGDQQLLSRDLANNNVPSPSSSYPVVTPKFWSISCLPSLANAPTLGEGFLATSPEGTKYRFDHMVSFGMESIGKSSASGGMMTTMEVTAQLDVGGTPSPQIGVDHSLARNEIYIFPTEVTDRFGNWVRYTYDPANPKNVTTITSSDGRQLTFTYGYGWTSHLITAITDGTRTWTYAYNAAVQGLSTVTLPDASTWNLANIYPLLANVNPQSMGCDNASTLNATAIAGSMVHPSGATGSFTLTRKVHGRSDVPQVCAGGLTPYAAIPRHLHTFSLTGKAITGPGLPPAGYTWSYAYGVPNASWAPCGAGCPKSKTVTVTDPNLDVTRYTFGNQYRISEGRLEQVDLGWVAATSTAQRTTTTRYRAAGLGPYPSMLGYGGELISDGESLAKLMPVDQVVTTQQGASFTWQANAFDAFARATSVTRFNTLGASRTEATVYTDNPGVWVLGQVESVTVSGSPSAMVAHTYDLATASQLTTRKFGLLDETLSYHMDGTLATRMDGVNQATSYSNYKRGLPQNTGYANGTAESAVVSDIGVIESTTDQNGYTHTYGHDAMGRLSSIYYPAYDAVSWTPTTITLAQVAADEYGVASGHWRQTVETGNAQTISYLDALYRPVLTRTLDTAAPSSLKAVVQRYAFDGNVTFASYPQAWVGDVNAAVNGTTTTYNALKRRLTVVAASELGNLTTSYAYTTPFRTTVTNPRGKAITTSFSALDQPTDDAPSVMTLPYGIPVTIVRDIYGKPSSITRGSGGVSATRSYVYDGFQRLCKTVEPETGATIQSHDAAGNVQWRASGLNLPALNDCSSTSVPPASKVSFTYDTLNRLTGTTYSDGSPAITRTYTADGLPETVTSNGATWTTSYHRRRLPFQESLDYAGTTYRLTTGYNANGHADTLTYPDSTVVPYTLNALGEAATVGGYGQLITYHPTGALASFTYGNNITRSMTPNARGLPWQVSEPGILQDVYDYDANGNVARITDQVAGAVTTRTMTYDDLDRLSGVSAPALWGNAAYTYDNLDNIVASSVSAGATARSLSHAIDYATNRISSLSGTPSYSFGYAYDAQGNIVQRGAQAYVFDQGNRLASAPGKATYTYDGLGRRVRIVQADGTNRIQVYSGAGQLMYAVQTGGPLPPATTRYIYLHRHLLAEVTGAGVQYNHTDALGSPVASTSGAGGLLTRTRYEPYGMTAAGTTPTIGFTGHVNDADTGLINMQQRYYDPVAGRFLSIDPVTTDANSGGNFNRYAYANNSPYKYIDPDGRDPGEAYNPLLFRLTTFEGAKQGTTIGHAIANGAVARDAGAPLIAAADHLVANSGNIIAAVGQIKAGGRVAGPITNPTIGKVGRVIVDGKGNAMLEPAGGKTVPAGKGGVDTHTLYPNLSNAQRLNPQGHPNNPTPHGHQHQPGTGAGKSGQGPSTDPQGNVVKSNSSDAHWPIN